MTETELPIFSESNLTYDVDYIFTIGSGSDRDTGEGT